MGEKNLFVYFLAFVSLRFFVKYTTFALIVIVIFSVFLFFGF